jgi:hypothetical protein
MAGGARLQSRVFVDGNEDRATGVARPQRMTPPQASLGEEGQFTGSSTTTGISRSVFFW